MSHRDVRQQVQSLLDGDSLWQTLSSDPRTTTHARQRAAELAETAHATEQERALGVVQSSLRNLEGECASLRQQLKAARQSLAESKREGEEQALAAERAAYEHTRHVKDLEALRAERQGHSAALRAAHADKRAAEKAAAVLDSKLAAAASAHALRTKELESSKAALAAALDERSRQQAALHTQLDAATADLEHLRRASREAEGALLAQLGDVRAEAAQLRAALEGESAAAGGLARRAQAAEDAAARARDVSAKQKAALKEAESLLRRSERDR